ncbi:NACHT domain-containing protein [Actinoplanes sp. NPDC023936]|uniref:NACHT domain-containing protein n=1 Tax=Actinoplanes sp. NPDC023936 TaxID=3154910 RepID=UPI0033F0D355
MTELPFDLTYAAVGAAVLALAGAIIQQVFADQIRSGLAAVWRGMRGGRGSLRRDEWTRYRLWVKDTDRNARLGFLRDIQVAVEDVYVPLQYEKDGKRVDVYRDVSGRLRTIVVGPAGAGKSMLLRHSMLRWSADPQRDDRVPVLVELARYNRGDRTLEQLVADVFAVRPGHGKRPMVKDAPQVVGAALNRGRLSLFLDGLDEVMTERRANVADEIKEFAERHPACQIVVTCRDAVYDKDLFPVFDAQIRVAGFDDAGIRHFLRLWFTREQGHGGGADEAGNVPPNARALVEQLMGELRANPALMRLARTPLMLTMIASLHDADPGAGPLLTNSRADFYEEAITHLLRRDHDLGRNRNLAQYRASHKRTTLRALAVAAQGTEHPDRAGDRNVLSEAEIYTVVGTLVPRFGLTATDGRRLVDEIVDRSGLLVRIDDTNLFYQFAHLTLQEYLAAQELADDPDRLLELYRGNRARWRETVKLWCGGVNRDATPLVSKIFAGDAKDRLLALECVAEARHLDADLADRIVDGFVGVLGTDQPDKPLVFAALGAVAADRTPTGERLFARLRDGAANPDYLIVLAESRRREAIEVLSERAGTDRAAREALRRLGELAIPVLAHRAANGSVDAIDDLGAIATPAAATAIAEQLWLSVREVAIRAAWWLAVLIRQPEIEGELSRFDPVPFRRDSEKDYLWLWEPFTSDHHTRIIMGRAGWLLDQPTDQPLAELPAPDSRVALGVGAQAASFRQVDPPDGWFSDLTETATSSGHRRRRPLEKANENNYGGWLEGLADSDPDTARRLALAAIDTVVGRAYRFRLLRTLPTPVLVGIVKRFWPSNTLRDAAVRDWQTIGDEPVPPNALRVVRNTVSSIAGVVGAFLLLLGIYDAILDTYRWLTGADGSYSFVILPIVVASVVALIFEVRHSTDTSAFITGFGFILTGLVGVPVGMFPVAGWIGWPATIGIVTLLTAAVVVLWSWTRRRERAVGNPYRALLRLDDQVSDFGRTVIARRSRA